MNYLKIIIILALFSLSTGQSYSQSYGKRVKTHMGIKPKKCKKKHRAMRRHGIAGLTGSAQARSRGSKIARGKKRRRS